LGSLKYFLGIEIARSKHGIFISHQKYILDLLKETGMLRCKATDNPIEVNVKLGEGRALWWIRAYISDWLDS
jgi:hypothetical protein